MPRSSSRSDDVGPYRAAPPETEADPIPEALYDALQSPSLFGRILLIAAFRSAASDRYDAGHSALFDTSEIESALRRLHQEIFRNWLALPLQRQKADVSIYLNAGPAADRASRLKQLVALGKGAVPPGAKRPERDLFVADLKIVQVLFNYDR